MVPSASAVVEDLALQSCARGSQVPIPNDHLLGGYASGGLRSMRQPRSTGRDASLVSDSMLYADGTWWNKLSGHVSAQLLVRPYHRLEGGCPKSNSGVGSWLDDLHGAGRRFGRRGARECTERSAWEHAQRYASRPIMA